MKYRVVKEGKIFMIQKKVLGLFWVYVSDSKNLFYSRKEANNRKRELELEKK